jgi:quercetin dioxygenase-like cupin family protein
MTVSYKTFIVTPALLLISLLALAQDKTPGEGFGVCKPVSQRTTELGCWILTDTAVGRLKGEVFWYLDSYSTRAAAEKAKGIGGTVVESLGKVWLLTINTAGSQSSPGGQRVAAIGPIPVTAGEEYSSLYMEAVMTPGMTSTIHTHSGPEIWYTLAGETCLETPQGKFVERPNGPPVIVPAGSPMHLTATGTEKRRAIVLILHLASEKPTTVINTWKPKGLCKADVGPAKQLVLWAVQSCNSGECYATFLSGAGRLPVSRANPCTIE